MNDSHDDELTIPRAEDVATPSNALETTAEQEAHSDETPADETPAMELASEPEARRPRPKRAKRSQKRHTEEPQRRGPAALKRPAMFRRVVFIAWSGEREPASDLWWVEATVEGEWVIVQELERIRTRKEILERILALDHGFIALDFNFSFPAAFLEFLSAEGIADWRAMVRTIREDLKKNVDDGARLWVERMARYREAFLDTAMPSIRPRAARLTDGRRSEDRRWNAQPHPPERHELQSMAERFRRTDLPLLPVIGRNELSTIQIGYNRLTERYEFNGNPRGRDSLLGMSMLGQLLEAGRDDLAIWPMMELKRLTIVETLPWLFTEGTHLEEGALKTLLENYEDAGWHIPDEVQRNAAKSSRAQHALRSLLGILKSEGRMLRSRFPIRFYNAAIYRDPQVQREGWMYGINYRLQVNGNDAKETVKSDSSPRRIASES